jgi:hypothetical protein
MVKKGEGCMVTKKRCEEASDQAQAGYYSVAEPCSFVDNPFYGKLGPRVTNQAQAAIAHLYTVTGDDEKEKNVSTPDEEQETRDQIQCSSIDAVADNTPRSQNVTPSHLAAPSFLAPFRALAVDVAAESLLAEPLFMDGAFGPPKPSIQYQKREQCRNGIRKEWRLLNTQPTRIRKEWRLLNTQPTRT